MLENTLKKYQVPTHDAVCKLITDAKSSSKAQFILDQINNYENKSPRYSEMTIRLCIVWRCKSPKGYEHARWSNMLTLPCRATLLTYTGSTTGDTSVTSLIKKRLLVEVQAMDDVARLCSLQIDEMAVKPSLVYAKQLDM